MKKYSFTKKELMVEVKNRSKIGIAYAKMQLGFIKWLLKQSGIKGEKCQK